MGDGEMGDGAMGCVVSNEYHCTVQYPTVTVMVSGARYHVYRCFNMYKRNGG
jgi:hypothetical protein